MKWLNTIKIMKLNYKLRHNKKIKRRAKSIMFHCIKYKDLKPRQQENFNFQKLAAKLADYGYNCMRLNDDWQGADFIACHIDGTFIKVQLKGRLTIDKKYNDKEIQVAFNQDGKWYLYPHDQLQAKLKGRISHTESWKGNGSYNWSNIPTDMLEHMTQYAIPNC